MPTTPNLPSDRAPRPLHVAVIGAGPAGLMAAEALAAGGAQVDVYDAMPSVGRKFLLAGKGGLNLTHSEPAASFATRYAERQAEVGRWLAQLDAQGLRDWAQGLGIATFVGSSGKVFPAEMKAAPLLRAWLHRLRASGVRFHMRHRWNGALDAVASAGGSAAEPATGQATEAAADRGAEVAAVRGAEAAADRGAEDGAEPAGPGWQVRFDTPAGPRAVRADAVLLALGGASWARLGSDGAWQPWLAGRGVDVRPLLPSNCGFDVAWSAHLRERHAGAPLKNVALAFDDGTGAPWRRLGEAVLSAQGLEGNLVYAASARLREAIAAQGHVDVTLDLLPARELADLSAALSRGRAARSITNHLKEHAGLHGAKAGLLREGLDTAAWNALCADPAALAARIKALPLRLLSPRPIDEAISSAGGVRLEATDDHLMLRACPGVSCAGEMLDWEAPTGGYLLQACCASGLSAGRGLLAWWATRPGA